MTLKGPAENEKERKSWGGTRGQTELGVFFWQEGGWGGVGRSRITP